MTGIIPNFEDCPITDQEGMLTPIWKNILSGTIYFLQQNHSQEGLVSPQQNTTNIATLTTLQSIGSMIYNTDLNQYQVCSQKDATTSEFRTITTSKMVEV